MEIKLEFGAPRYFDEVQVLMSQTWPSKEVRNLNRPLQPEIDNLSHVPVMAAPGNTWVVTVPAVQRTFWVDARQERKTVVRWYDDLIEIDIACGPGDVEVHEDSRLRITEDLLRRDGRRTDPDRPLPDVEYLKKLLKEI